MRLLKNISGFAKRISCAGLGLAVLCGVSNSKAAPLAPGTFFVTPGAADPVGASTLFTTNVIWTPSLTLTGALTSSVLIGDTSNPWVGSGGLTFTYQFTITSSTISANQLTVGGFTGFLTDVSFQAPPVGVVPPITSRSVDGDAIRFFFSAVSTGQTTALLVVQTDATNWGFNIGSVLNSSAVPNITIAAPATVPEPTSAGLIFLGMGVVTYYRRLISKKSAATLAK